MQEKNFLVGTRQDDEQPHFPNSYIRLSEQANDGLKARRPVLAITHTGPETDFGSHVHLRHQCKPGQRQSQRPKVRFPRSCMAKRADRRGELRVKSQLPIFPGIDQEYDKATSDVVTL